MLTVLLFVSFQNFGERGGVSHLFALPPADSTDFNLLAAAKEKSCLFLASAILVCRCAQNAVRIPLMFKDFE